MADDATLIKQAFEAADLNGDGKVCRAELKNLLVACGNMTEDNVDTLITAFDKDGDGTFSYNEFVDWIMADEGGESLAKLRAAGGIPAPRLRELKQFIHEEVSQSPITGLSVAVVKGDAFLWHAQFGKCAAKKGAPQVGPNTKFIVASVSKTFIGVAAVILQERGLLSLEEPINDRLPYEVTNPHFPDTPITLRMLLTHTSSISDDGYDELDESEVYGKNDASLELSGRKQTMDDFFRELLSKDGKRYSEASFLSSPDEAPGSYYLYSNVGSSLAGHICELAARQAGLIDAANGTFDDLVHRVILEPLGVPQDNGAYLCSSFSSDKAAKMPAVAIPCCSEEKRFARDVGLYTFSDYPNGGMIITAKDYARMMGAVMNDGSFCGSRIMQPETCQALKELRFDNGSDKSAIIFYFNRLAGRELLGHNGGEEGIATEAYWNPQTQVGFVVFANEGWDDDGKMEDIFHSIEEEILDAFEPKEYIATLDRSGDDEGEEGEDGEEEEDYSDSECSGYDSEAESDGEGSCGSFAMSAEEDDDPRWHRKKHTGDEEARKQRLKPAQREKVAKRRAAKKARAAADRDEAGGSLRKIRPRRRAARG